jgi:hypothetical protein
MFKVLSPIPKRDGTGTWWMRLGNAFTNKDNSINVYLDAVPRDLKFTLWEMTEADLRQRSPSESNSRAVTAAGNAGPGEPSPTSVPF